jgi:hypothetical protein
VVRTSQHANIIQLRLAAGESDPRDGFFTDNVREIALLFQLHLRACVELACRGGETWYDVAGFAGPSVSGTMSSPVKASEEGR